MRDPHVHVRKDMGLDEVIRWAITEVTGLATDAYKTVATGCGKRRPYVMTSMNPEAVTCLACRDFAAAHYAEQAASAEGLAELVEAGEFTESKRTPAEWREVARKERDLAVRFGGERKEQ